MTSGWQAALTSMQAPQAVVQWASGFATIAAAAESCTRADWLIWLGRAVAQNDGQRKAVVRAQLGTIAMSGLRPQVWRAHLLRLAPDRFDRAQMQTIDDSVLVDSDHRLSDLFNAILVGLVLIAPLDLWLFHVGREPSVRLNREWITLPLYGLLIVSLRVLWRRLRLRFAARARLAPEASIEELMPLVFSSCERASPAVRAAQLLAAKTALAGTVT